MIKETMKILFLLPFHSKLHSETKQ